jgi:hypothetical protein
VPLSSPEVEEIMRHDIVPVGLAFLMAMALIFVAENYFGQHSASVSDKEVIWFLEFSAVVLIFVSFMVSEFLNAFRYIFRLIRGEKVSRVTVGPGMRTLFTAVIVSLCIYFSFLNLRAHP